MSISQNFPAISPSLSLNFARSKTLDPRITFSRTSTATSTNDQGLVEVMSADEPRFDHRYENGVVKSLGLLVEEQRTNIIQVSAPEPADISNNTNIEGWADRQDTIYNLTFTSTISPSGSNDAVNVYYSASYSNFMAPFIYNQQSLLSNNTFYTLSFWADLSDLVEVNGEHLTVIVGTNSYSSSNARYFRINLNRDSDAFDTLAYFTGSSVTAETANIIFPSASISGKVTNYPNNYKRIQVTFKVENYDGFFDSANTLADVRFSYGIYMGINGATNSNVGKNLKAWGWQLEEGTFSTSYIPTDGSTATRNPDNVSMTGTNFTDWYNQSEGTFVTLHRQNDVNDIAVNYGIYSLSNSPTNTDRLRFFVGASVSPVFNTVISNITYAYINVTPLLGINLIDREGELIKSSTRYSDVDCSVVIEGSDLATDNTDIVIPSTLNNMIIGAGGGGVKQLCGHISQLTYYPRRLTNAQLQNLTK